MNLYHCMITLKSDAKALAFASAAEHWLSGLLDRKVIGGWTLYRRKFGLASGQHSDILLLIEIDDLAQLEAAFRSLSDSVSETDQRHFDLVHNMIEDVQIGLYRPYPDAANRERVSLI